LCYNHAILKNTNLLYTIPNEGERGYFDILNQHLKVRIQILECFKNLSFSHRSIVEHVQKLRDDCVKINDISKNSNFLLIIPNEGERGHFEIINQHLKVQIWIWGSF